jgi:hypothetical protein
MDSVFRCDIAGIRFRGCVEAAVTHDERLKVAREHCEYIRQCEANATRELVTFEPQWALCDLLERVERAAKVEALKWAGRKAVFVADQIESQAADLEAGR